MAKATTKKAAPAQKKPRGLKYKLVANTAPVDELYVDGVVSFIARAGVIKLDCYRVQTVEKDGDKAEIRQITNRVVLPTAALPELYYLLKGVLESRKPPAAR